MRRHPTPGTGPRLGSREERRPARVGALVDRFLEETGLKEQVERMDALDLWAARVGEGIAKVTRARAVVGATLIVEVRSSAWMMELNVMKGEILGRLNGGRGAPGIERIRFVLGEEPLAEAAKGDGPGGSSGPRR